MDCFSGRPKPAKADESPKKDEVAINEKQSDRIPARMFWIWMGRKRPLKLKPGVKPRAQRVVRSPTDKPEFKADLEQKALEFDERRKKAVDLPTTYVHPPLNDENQGNEFTGFDRKSVEEMVSKNPDCEKIMWLDAFSMVNDLLLAEVIGTTYRALWKQYLSWRRLIVLPDSGQFILPNGALQTVSKPTPPAPNAIPDPSPAPHDIELDARLASNFPVVCQMLRNMRKAWAEWFKDPANTKRVRDGPYAVKYIADICDKLGVKVRFLDLELYPTWMAGEDRLVASTSHGAKPDEGVESSQLVDWVFFELYMRGSNFGSSGDLLRAQILFEQGGIYVDHDDQLNTQIHDPEELQKYFHTTAYTGVKVGVGAFEEDPVGADYLTNHSKRDPKDPWMLVAPASGYIAASPRNPVIRRYRRQMLDNYQRLLNNQFQWYVQDEDTAEWVPMYPEGVHYLDYRKPEVAKKFKAWEDWAINVTGPDGLERVLA
ncbi:hypothetical protein F4677DRAFT_414586, partial [Hypoxylon crocopeplum]